MSLYDGEASVVCPSRIYLNHCSSKSIGHNLVKRTLHTAQQLLNVCSRPFQRHFSIFRSIRRIAVPFRVLVRFQWIQMNLSLVCLFVSLLDFQWIPVSLCNTTTSDKKPQNTCSFLSVLRALQYKPWNCDGFPARWTATSLTFWSCKTHFLIIYIKFFNLLALTSVVILDQT